MIALRISILNRIESVLSKKIVYSTRLFTSTNYLAEKLYAPPVVIKKQDIAKREIFVEEYCDNRPQEDSLYLSSLSQYLKYENGGHNMSAKSVLGSVFPFLAQQSYYPKLKIHSDGYLMDPRPGPFKNSNNIVIIGGGLVGYSIAHHINRIFQGSLEVTIIENDYKQPQLATSYPMGKIKQQFVLDALINLSQYGIEFLDKVIDELSFESYVPEIDVNYAGVLMLADANDGYNIRRKSFFQRAQGVRTDMLTNAALKDRFPWINVQDLGGASVGIKQEGWYDNKKLLEALQLNCEYYGNVFLEGEITDSNIDVELNNQSLFLSKISELSVKLSNGEKQSVDCGTVVLAAGISSPKIATLFDVGSSDDRSSPYSYQLPIEKRVAYITQFHALNGPGINCPFVVDPSGVYFRRDGLENSYICEWKVCPGNKPLANCTEINTYFKENIFPILCNRVKSFKQAEIGDSTECPYDYNYYDTAPIIGFHPSVSNLFLSCGFSQNGFQALGVGKYLTDLLLDKNPNLDLDTLKINRIKREDLYR